MAKNLFKKYLENRKNYKIVLVFCRLFRFSHVYITLKSFYLSILVNPQRPFRLHYFQKLHLHLHKPHLFIADKFLPIKNQNRITHQILIRTYFSPISCHKENKMNVLKYFMEDEKVDQLLNETYFQAFLVLIFLKQEKKVRDKGWY